MNERKIVLMKYGSQLYGTAGPDSDTDYKGVFMPSSRDVLLGRIPRSVNRGVDNGPNAKNTDKSVDHEEYSLHYFLKMACEGQTVCLDMLHAPAEAYLESSEIWRELCFERDRFYTKRLNALVGYARRQASIYSVKGVRLADARKVQEILNGANEFTLIGDLDLPELEHGHWIQENVGVRVYEICGKQLQATAQVRTYRDTLDRFVTSYGERARKAEQSEGVDWKALSHAFRAAYQVKHILTEGWFTFPLPETPKIIAVKQGILPYIQVAEEMESLIDEVEALADKSALPAKVDREYWDNWLEGVVREEL